MPRPCCLRHIDVTPCAVYFKPAGIPVHLLEEVVLTLDELESLRLADLNGLYQEQAAGQMKISRPTFSRVVEQARRKVADALIHGKALRLEGGAVVVKGEEHEDCHSRCRISRTRKPSVRAFRVCPSLRTGGCGNAVRQSDQQ